MTNIIHIIHVGSVDIVLRTAEVDEMGPVQYYFSFNTIPHFQWTSIYQFKKVTWLPLFVCDNVCMYVCQLSASFTYFGQLLRCAPKRIVNIMKVYIKRNNMQVELIRFRKKISTLFTFTFAKRGIFQPTRCLRSEIDGSVWSIDRAARLMDLCNRL